MRVTFQITPSIYAKFTELCSSLGCSYDQGVEFAMVEWMRGGYQLTIAEANKYIDKKETDECTDKSDNLLDESAVDSHNISQE